MMCRSTKGFSLIEVVIALAIVVGGVAVILALLPGLVRNSVDASAMQIALRLPDAVQVELQREMGTGFASFASSFSSAGLQLVAEQDGSNLRRADSPDATLRSRFYLIEVRKFTSGDLVYAAGDGVLPLQVTVSWPYQVLAGDRLLAASEAKDRESVTFNLALNP